MKIAAASITRFDGKGRTRAKPRPRVSPPQSMAPAEKSSSAMTNHIGPGMKTRLRAMAASVSAIGRPRAVSASATVSGPSTSTKAASGRPRRTSRSRAKAAPPRRARAGGVKYPAIRKKAPMNQAWFTAQKTVSSREAGSLPGRTSR